ncbi:gastric inhibitory polypeptide [Scomber scombrus]|nr:gastric inhibitory polypeptide [Scomber scombrus]
MKVLLFELMVICLLAALHAQAKIQPADMGLSEEEKHLGKRYAESTIASEMSKIMDSMVQKNFVDFLLSQKQKRSKPVYEEHQFNDLLKLSLQEKQRRNI